MSATRFSLSNTGHNAGAAIALVANPLCRELRLFASPRTDHEGKNRDTNLPLLAMLATMDLPNAGTEHVVYDGTFLTAARYPRYMEVREVLDAMVGKPKVWAGTARAPFTEDMTPTAAVVALMAVPVENLTVASRKAFFALLCSITEAEYAKLSV